MGGSGSQITSGPGSQITPGSGLQIRSGSQISTFRGGQGAKKAGKRAKAAKACHHQVNDDLPVIKMIQILQTLLQKPRPSPDKIHQTMMNCHPLEERKETLLQLKTNGNRRRKIHPAPHPIPVRRPETEVAILLMEKITRKSYADLLPPKISINLIPPILIHQVILQNQKKIAKNEGQRKREEADQ